MTDLGLSDSSYICNVCRFSFKQPKVWNNNFGHCPFVIINNAQSEKTIFFIY